MRKTSAIDKYDIIVVGAGPAGVIATLHAKGDILLVEKNKKIGVPVRCGEATYGNIIDRFDLRDCVKGMHILHDMEFFFSNGKQKKLTIHSNDIFVLDKDVFLQNILHKAVRNQEDKHITIRTNAKASYKDGDLYINDEIIDGRVIIDASGISSSIGRAVGLSSPLDPEDIHVCAQYTLKGDIDPSKIRLFIDNPYAPSGYVWVIPKGDGTANVGIGMQGSKHFNVKQHLDWFINDNYPDCEKTNYFMMPLGLAPPVNRCVKDNVLLAGESASFVISISGGGIGTSMLSGMYAGITASDYIDKGTSLLAYQYAMEKMLYKKLRKSYKIKQKFMEYGITGGVYNTISLLFLLQSKFPKLMERVALKNLRF